MILLNHYEDETFKDGRIATNVAKVIHISFYLPFIDRITQVPYQPNGKDCGCFVIYFGKRFLQNPDGTMAVIKVMLLIFSTIQTNFQY